MADADRFRVVWTWEPLELGGAKVMESSPPMAWVAARTMAHSRVPAREDRGALIDVRVVMTDKDGEVVVADRQRNGFLALTAWGFRIGLAP